MHGCTVTAPDGLEQIRVVDRLHLVTSTAVLRPTIFEARQACRRT